MFVGAFRERPLKGSFPYRRLDALWLNVRQDHWIVSQAHLVAIDGRGTADREIMGFSLGRSEEYASGRISCGD